MRKSLVVLGAILLLLVGGVVGWFAAKRHSNSSEPGQKDQLELFQAAERGQLSRVEQLLARGAGVNDKNAAGETVLMIAAANNHVAIVQKVLYDLKADLNERDNNGEDALMKAAANGHLAVIQVILDSRNLMMLKGQDRNGMTALMKAAAQGHELVVKEIVDYRNYNSGGFDIKMKDRYGKTALDHAQASGHKAIVTFLEPKMK